MSLSYATIAHRLVGHNVSIDERNEAFKTLVTMDEGSYTEFCEIYETYGNDDKTLTLDSLKISIGGIRAELKKSPRTAKLYRDIINNWFHN